MKTKISIIIPTYNRAQVLERALYSVFQQTRSAEEVIVVDDGSTDHTQKMITRKFPEVQYFYQNNQGVSSARNRGIKEAKCDWLAFLDSDDEWLPHKLETQIAALQENSYADSKISQLKAVFPSQNSFRICHSNEIWIRNGQRVNPKKKHRKFGGYIFEKCLPLCAISPSSVIIHRSIFDTVGMFDELLPACEDYDLWLRICNLYPVLYLNSPLIIKYGGHIDQLSRKYWGMDRFRIQALEKIIATRNLEKTNLKAALITLIQKLTIYIQGADKRQKFSEVECFQEKKNYYLKNYKNILIDN